MNPLINDAEGEDPRGEGQSLLLSPDEIENKDLPDVTIIDESKKRDRFRDFRKKRRETIFDLAFRKTK